MEIDNRHVPRNRQSSERGSNAGNSVLWDLPLVTQSYELGAFGCFVGMDHWSLITNNAHWMAFNGQK